jgi:hypothetical protein
MAGRKPKRKGRRSRLKTVSDSQTQLQQISSAQKAARQRKITTAIDSIEKSKQRFLNSLRRIKDADDAYREFE